MNNKPPRKKSVVEPVDVVTSVGNAWIITRSKSHPGRIYYFNTLTGEAVWNLSSTDIEKAKRTTNILQNQPGTNLENYPEPKEPPTDNNLLDHNKSKAIQPFTPSKICNEQFMNSQFRQPFGMNSIVSTQCVKCTSINTFNSSDANLSAPAAFNPNIWAIPPNHQIVIAPTQSPIVNQTQTSVNVAYNNMDSEMLVQHTTLPLSSRFKDTQYSKFDNRNQRVGLNNNNQFSPGFYRNKFFQRNYTPKNSFYNKFNRSPNLSNKDLRQILCFKRNINKSQDTISQGSSIIVPKFNQEKSNMQLIKIIKPPIEELCPSDVDDNWLKEYAFVQGTQLKLNIEQLKNIVVSKQDVHCWYIVIDSSTLLNHFNLINTVVNSDEQCQLMIQKTLMTELRTMSRSADMNLMNRALIVLQLLTQQFAAHRAVLGVESGDCTNYDILDFSIKFSEQNNNVALVSNNMKFKSYKTRSIPIFTIKELKDILSNGHLVSNTNLQNQLNDSITITIPNNINHKADLIGLNAASNAKSKLDKDHEMNESNNKKPNYVIENSVISKNTIEMGVQTDCIESCVNNALYKPHNQKENVFTKNDANTNEVPKRRLIRNVSHQQNDKNEKNADKRQFVWRRKKRNISATHIVQDEHAANNNLSDISVSNTKEKADETVSYSDYHPIDNMSRDMCSEKNYESKSSHEDNCSETTNSSIFNPKDNNQRIIIEETSTSGVISNTPSNVDTESEHSVMPVTEINMKNYETNDKCVMFEIESPRMEECLKMKCDEWVSRFVQIMEEVLTEILQLDPPFYSAMMPPPWTLHEAAACIKKKFYIDSDIIDAASKLADVLYKISDERGKINVRLEPTEFMEMYSYGVYLVDSLQTRFSECEDLQTAQESLAHLLSDIQDHNTFNAQNDTFSDNNNDDLSANVTPLSTADTAVTNGLADNANRIQEEVKKILPVDENDDQSKRYNLRSGEKRRNEVANEQTVKFVRNIDLESTFFFTLNLKRKPIQRDNLESVGKNVIIETNEEDENEGKDIPVPTIIRNFSKCLEFEERLKKKEKQGLDMSLSNYTDDEHAYDCYDEDYNSNEDYMEECEMNFEENDSNQYSEYEDIEKYEINDFKWIAGRIMSDVQETFFEVHLFCDKTLTELETLKTLNPSRRNEIQEQAQEAHKHMCNLCISLNSILHRMENSYNMEIILKQADIIVDAETSDQYRDKIAKCLEQAAVLLDALNMVIEAVE